MADAPSHLDHVRDDTAYADILAGWDAAFYAKFTAALRPDRPGCRVLDIGCGVGQVVATLTREGHEAHGVDVSGPNIARARAFTDRCRLYDGDRLPYPDAMFDRVGALNVVEHVREPEAFIAEAVRVCVPGGRVVLSSPNFLRCLGWRDYHPRMRGVGNKLSNLRALLDRLSRMRSEPDRVRFERMTPVIKEPFSPDDDAIVCTNALDIAFFLRRSGCTVVEVACTDRVVPAAVDFLLNATPLKYGMFNAWVVGRRR
jgi:SAM-dependent methyltransferase